jgi:hypothetical protein
MIDKHGNELFEHEQREVCPMDGETQCGCYVGHEGCLKAEREEMNAHVAEPLRSIVNSFFSLSRGVR